MDEKNYNLSKNDQEWFDMKDRATIKKAKNLMPMSIKDLFIQIYGKRLDKYNLPQTEYLRLISIEFRRLSDEIEMLQVAVKRLKQEAAAIHQANLEYTSCLHTGTNRD